MVAAHFLNPRAILLALTALILVSGCSRDTGPEESPQDNNFISREGVDVEFSVQPIHGGVGEVAAGEWADVTFKVTDATTGEAIKGRYPAAWMDLGAAWEAMGEGPMECRDRVAFYLQGIALTAAQQVVKPDNLVWIVVGDRAVIEEKIRALDLGEMFIMDGDGNILEGGTQ